MNNFSLFFLNTDRSLCKEVGQVPPAILGRLHGSATISCSHSISSYDTILWYQQSLGNSELKLIGYVFYSSSTTEKPFIDNSFIVTGDGSKKVELHDLKLRHPEDSGMYYDEQTLNSLTPVSNHRLPQEIVTDKLPLPVLTNIIQIHCSQSDMKQYQ